jgi:hypothetical protein
MNRSFGKKGKREDTDFPFPGVTLNRAQWMRDSLAKALTFLI